MSSISLNDLVIIKDIGPSYLKEALASTEYANPIGKIGKVVSLSGSLGFFYVEVVGVQFSFTRDQLEVVYTV